MDLFDSLLQPGDRVRIVHGSAQGKTGTVQGWDGEKIVVKSDETGNDRRFPPKWVAHLPGGRPERSTVSQSQVKEVRGNGWIETVDGQMLNPVHHAVVPDGLQSDGENDDVVSDGLHSLASLVGSVVPHGLPDQRSLTLAISVLESERTKLASTALTNCWLKSHKRGSREYTRLVWGKATGKPAQYLEGKEVPHYQERINQGRILRSLDAVLSYLRSQSDGEGT